MLPVTFLTWKARNPKSVELNDPSNYTTNPNNSSKGWNPCENSYIFHTGKHRDDTMSSIHHELFEPYYHTLSHSGSSGYNCKSYTRVAYSRDVKSGCVFDKIEPKLIIKLGDTNPYLFHGKTSEMNGSSRVLKISSDSDTIELNREKKSVNTTPSEMYEIIVNARTEKIVSIDNKEFSVSSGYSKIGKSGR